MLLCEWVLRPDGHPFDPYTVYIRFSTVFSLEIHHGSELSKAPDQFYDGGKVHWFDQIDSDGFSVVEVTHMLAGLGYVNPKMKYWYKMPDKDALLPLIDKPKPLGDNENPETKETFDPFFCDLDPDVGEPSEVPNVGEHNKVPNMADQTEIPNDAEHSNGSEESDDSDFGMDLEDMIEEVDVDMADFRKYTDKNIEWVGPNKVLVEDTQPVEAEVFEDLDLEDFDSASDPDDGMVSRLVVENRRQLWLSKNDKVRFRAQCRGIVSTFSDDDGSQFGPNGPSGLSGSSGTSVKSKLEKTKMADSQKTIKPNPKIPILALKDQLQKKFELGVSKAKVFREKQMAQDNVIGDYVNHYARLKYYALELQEQNPDTTIKIDVERTCDVTSDTRKFRRIYVCLGALKSGFKAGKRDLLGLDGCFMSGPYLGQILTVVGVDPNNGTYPLAYVVVEAEKKDSWTWFLDCLGDDLQLARNSNFTFITDRQKDLVPALQEMFPAAEHRYSTSPKVQLFKKNMEELRRINKEVYDWLKLISPHHWARSHFSGELYQATGPHGTQYVCNMTQRTCLCKKWDLTRIPCKHAVACIWDMASNGQVPGIPESWVSECYWLSTWQEMYRFKVNPCRLPKKRKKSAAELFDGMVKKGKLSRAGKSVTCTKCGQVGHNSRSCKGQRGPTVNQSQASASVSARPSGNQSQTSVTPSVPTVSQSQIFVRPTPPLRPTAPSIKQTAPFLRPTAPFVTPRFTKTTANRLSPIKKPACANG
ncbi:mutator type transposase, partial [Tanacetum coccineum]